MLIYFCIFVCLCGSLDGGYMGKWAKKDIWHRMDHTGPCRFASNCVCMKKTLFIKSLDINKTLPKLFSTDVATPPCHPRAATRNSLWEIDICLFVKSPLLLWESCTEKHLILERVSALDVLGIMTINYDIVILISALVVHWGFQWKKMHFVVCTLF